MFGLVKKTELDKEKVQNLCLNRIVEVKESELKATEKALIEKEKEYKKLILLNKQKDSNISALDDEIKGLKDKINDLHLTNEKLTSSRKLVTKEVAEDLLKEVDSISKDIRKIIHAHIGLDNHVKRGDYEKILLSSNNIMFLSVCEKGINNFKALLNELVRDKASL